MSNSTQQTYFSNLSRQHIQLYAAGLRAVTRSEEDLSDEELIRSYSGDTGVEVIFEGRELLIIRSIDPAIMVDNIIPKLAPEEMRSYEVYEGSGLRKDAAGS